MEAGDSRICDTTSSADVYHERNDLSSIWPGFESGYAPQLFVPHVSSSHSASVTSSSVHKTNKSGQMVSDNGKAEARKRYCFCQKLLGDVFMIQCDACQDWFHGDCINIREEQGKEIEKYHCPNCTNDHGPLTLKNRPRWWESNVIQTESSNDDDSPIVTRNGCPEFIRLLKERSFSGPNDIPVLCMEGHDVTLEHIIKNGFTVPILVDNTAGLGITIPPSKTTAHDIEQLIGSMRELDVIEVAHQRERKMLMREWVDYYTAAASKRATTLNLISLEFSATKLGHLVEPPGVVKALSWVDNYWPKMRPMLDSEAIFLRPEVQKYCLMSVADSYTDFHVDFGGTSVWYHILRGEKIFYLIRPTVENLAAFEKWYLSAEQSETFFPDLIDDSCYRCVLKQGQTVFLPSGWIHAVLTPVDSMVFGGNFLHTFNIEMQLRVYAMERRTKTPEKYFFPNFETLHWYVAEKILNMLRSYRRRADDEVDRRAISQTVDQDGRENITPPKYLLRGASALCAALRAWTRTQSATQTIPDTMRSGRLLSDLQKQLNLWADEKDVGDAMTAQGFSEELWVERRSSHSDTPRRKRLKKNHFIR